MMIRVLDASVAVAWYVNESFSPSARHWQTLLLDGKAAFIIPSLHFWEVANVLRTHVARKLLSAPIAQEIYRLHLDAPLETAEPERDRVLSMALERGMSAYDAVYATLAVEREIPWLTAERTTKPWHASLGKLVEALT